MIMKTVPVGEQRAVRTTAEVRNNALLKTLSFIKADWNLNYEQMGEMTHIPGTTLQRWLSEPTDLGNKKNELELLTHFISIHKSLTQMFGSKKNLNHWLETEHPHLKGAPRELIKRSIEGLILVRRYLDFQRGRGA